MSYTIEVINGSASAFQKEIDIAEIPNDGVVYSENFMTVLGDFTAGQEAEIDALVPLCQLECAKEEKLSEIVFNTKRLIDIGFEYDLKVYPLVADSRSNYVGIQVFGEFPYVVQTQDKTDVITIPDQTEYDKFVASGMARFLYISNGESSLVVEVRDATTVSNVNAIVDSRV